MSRGLFLGGSHCCCRRLYQTDAQTCTVSNTRESFQIHECFERDGVISVHRLLCLKKFHLELFGCWDRTGNALGPERRCLRRNWHTCACIDLVRISKRRLLIPPKQDGQKRDAALPSTLGWDHKQWTHNRSQTVKVSSNKKQELNWHFVQRSGVWGAVYITLKITKKVCKKTHKRKKHTPVALEKLAGKSSNILEKLGAVSSLAEWVAIPPFFFSVPSSDKSTWVRLSIAYETAPKKLPDFPDRSGG